MSPTGGAPRAAAPVAPSSPSLDGKRCVVTGGTDGIGLATARELARRGAEVIVVGRDRAKGERVVEELRATAGSAAVSLAVADLSVQRSVRALAAELLERAPRLDVLVNNAGAVFAERALTEDGIERTFALNHLGYFLLTGLLLPALRRAASVAGEARVVSVASDAHRRARLDPDDLQLARGYSGWLAYNNSKLANVLHSYELARRLAGTGVSANCLHPGVVRTRFGRSGSPLVSLFYRLAAPLLVSPERGARTPVYLAAAPEVAGVTGRYFERQLPVRSSPASYDEALARRLWEASELLAPGGGTGGTG